jgi:hypothetical protein
MECIDVVSAHRVQARSVYGYRSVCSRDGGYEEVWLCPRYCVIYFFMYAVPAFTLQEYTKVGPLNLFLQWTEGSLKGALSVRFKFRSDMLCWYSPSASIKFYAEQHRFSGRCHLSNTNVKALANSWLLVHICEHVVASKVASFFIPDLMVAIIVERIALLAVDSE